MIAIRHLALICCSVFLFLCKAQAITVFTDHKVFYLPKDSSFAPYLEAYWEIDPVSLNFENRDGSWQTRIRIDVKLSSNGVAFSEDHFILQTSPMPDKNSAMTQAILDLHRYNLREGQVRIDVSFTEVGSERSFAYVDSFTVYPIASTGMSELQLIDTAYRSQDQSPFLRNGMQHFPLNLAFLDDNRTSLNYYFEVYGLDKARADEPLILTTHISRKPYDSPVEGMMKTDTLSPGQVVPAYGSFPLRSLRSGNYYLNSAVHSKAGRELARSSVFFQRLNTHPFVDSSARSNEFDTASQRDVVVLNIQKTFVAKYTHPQLVAILKMLIPISEGAEKNNIYSFLSKPNELYTRYFIYNFWAARNKDKPEKEWEKYAEKVREVNRLFGAASKPGYETDRGLVYLKYGKPNERIIVTAEQNALPYEVWQYFTVEGQGRDGVFLFYQPAQLANDYVLLHSTVSGQARDMNWRSTIYPNGRRENTDSKAEQYLRNR